MQIKVRKDKRAESWEVPVLKEKAKCNPKVSTNNSTQNGRVKGRENDFKYFKGGDIFKKREVRNNHLSILQYCLLYWKVV